MFKVGMAKRQIKLNFRYFKGEEILERYLRYTGHVFYTTIKNNKLEQLIYSAIIYLIIIARLCDWI